MSLDLMLTQFKTLEEIQTYCEAQYSTILELSKQIQKKDEEIIHLKMVLESSTPLLEEQKKDFLGYNLAVPNEEIIANIQLNKLKEIAITRELTMEECKKTEVFAKILMALKSQNKNNVINVNAETISNDDLMKMLSDASK